MKYFKKYKSKILMISALSFGVLLIPFLVGCSQSVTNNNNNSDNISKPSSSITNNISESLKQEVQRVNKLNLSLSKQEYETNPIENINYSNFLSSFVSGFDKKNGFDYSVQNLVCDDTKLNQISFYIFISDKNNEVSSKQFILNFKKSNNYDQKLIDNEKQRIENITKTPITFYAKDESEKNSLATTFNNESARSFTKNWIQYNDKVFDYEFENAKTDEKYEYLTFDLKIKKNELSKEIKNIQIKIEVKENWEDKDTLEKEIENLKNQNLEFSNSTFTSTYLQNININNVESLLKNKPTVQNAGVAIKLNWISKDTSNVLKINYKVAKKENICRKDIDISTYQVTFDVPYKLKQVSQLNEVNTNYFKESANPYSNGEYNFASGSTNGITPSAGQGETSPSEGVEQNAKLEEGKVHTDLEINQLKNTFSLGFVDYSGAAAYGSGWILDYKISSETYPTTWYIATNSHVIQNLKIANDTISPERFSDEQDSLYANTKYLKMKNIYDPQKGVDYGNSSSGKYQEATISAKNLKTIFIGNDYLTTSPSEMIPKGVGGTWASSQEYIDFAVMEVKFNSSEEAKKMTNDYVGDPSRQFKYRNSSLLKNNNVIDKGYSVVGFPVDKSQGQSTWERPTILTTSRKKGDSSSDHTNLATSQKYNTFKDKKGVFDGALGLSFFGYNYRQAYSLTTFYISSGLMSGYDYGSLDEGSSGSMLMDNQGYTVGIHFAGDNKSSIGLATALFCEGFSYSGKFGKYNLEGYDLINGGFPNQRTSYKDGLKKLYGNTDLKTNLYKNGINNPITLNK